MVDFGKYVADCLPKYVQKVQLTSGDELEVLIAPEGILPTLQFLKDHHNAQFTNIVDIAGMDVPSRVYRFEVRGTDFGASKKLMVLLFHTYKISILIPNLYSTLNIRY